MGSETGNSGSGDLGVKENEKAQLASPGRKGEEVVLREGIFTVHYPTCKPLICEVFLTPTELVFEEYDESEYDSDCDIFEERFPVQDIFGMHTVRDDDVSPAIVYILIVLYTKTSETDSCRKRVARILEIQSVNSHEENLSMAKDWASDIECLLRRKYPNLHKLPSTSRDSSSDTGCPEESCGNSVVNLNSKRKEATDAAKENKVEVDVKEIGSDLDVEFCSGNFTYEQSLLFIRTFLVIINPASGQGKGISLFEEQIMPIFADSGIRAQLLVSQDPGHASNFLSTADLNNVDGIVAVGGDGLINEVVNGIRKRTDFTKVANIPIGMVATGSGNGLSRSISAYYGEAQEYRKNPVFYSALAVSRGCVAPVNLTEVHLDEKVFYSFLSVGWGLLSDIDIESEVLRAIGEIRFVIWSFIRLAKLRRYNAELSYIPYDAIGSINSRVIVKDEFVSVYSACQSHIGSDMMFAPETKPNDGTIHLTFLPSSTGRLAAAKFLAQLQLGQGQHIYVSPVKYVKVKEFTIRSEGGIQGMLTVDGERVCGEEITVKLSDSPLLVFCMQ